MSEPIENFPMHARAHALTKLAPTFSRLYQDMVEMVPPEAVDIGIASKKLSSNYMHGTALLYGAGLAAWQTMRDAIPDIDLSSYYSSSDRKTIEQYMFNVTPERVTSAFVQSAMTAPSIFMAWWADAAGICDRSAPRKQWGHELGTDQMLSSLSSPWFTNMLRDGSITNSGFYRNSTGFELSFAAHMTRSALRPMCAFEAETQGQIVSLEKGESPQLSKTFLTFLHARLRSHNIAVRDGSTPYNLPVEGTSAGCPVAREVASKTDVFNIAPAYLNDVVEKIAS